LELLPLPSAAKPTCKNINVYTYETNQCMHVHVLARERDLQTWLMKLIKNLVTLAGVWKLGLIREKDGKQLLGF